MKQITFLLCLIFLLFFACAAHAEAGSRTTEFSKNADALTVETLMTKASFYGLHLDLSPKTENTTTKSRDVLATSAFWGIPSLKSLGEEAFQ